MTGHENARGGLRRVLAHRSGVGGRNRLGGALAVAAAALLVGSLVLGSSATAEQHDPGAPDDAEALADGDGAGDADTVEQHEGEPDEAVSAPEEAAPDGRGDSPGDLIQVELRSLVEGTEDPVVEVVPPAQEQRTAQVEAGSLRSEGVDLADPERNHRAFVGRPVEGAALLVGDVTSTGLWVDLGGEPVLVAWGDADALRDLRPGEVVAVIGVVRMVSDRDRALVDDGAAAGDWYVHALGVER